MTESPPSGLPREAAPAARLIIIATVLALVLLSCFGWSLKLHPLHIAASRNTLRMGESVRLAVSRRTWLGTRALADPERLEFVSNFATLAVVEPDGQVTAVGTWGEARNTTSVIAFHGRDHGSLPLTVVDGGPGPTLDFEVEAPPAPHVPRMTCCSEPVQVAEGRIVRFSLHRGDSTRADVTPRSTGTRYSVFFGSGIPNDPNPSRIIGYGQGIDPTTFRIDDERGLIVAPASIGRAQYFMILVFARNGSDVGWKEIKLVHAR